MVVASGLTFAGGAASAYSAKVSPEEDYPRLPRSCVDPGGTIPVVPGICQVNDYRRARPTLVVWGDSHAYQQIPAMRVALAGRRVNLVAFVMGGCPPMDPNLKTPEDRKTASSCEKSNDRALRYVLNRKRLGLKTKVVLGSAWDPFLSLLRAGTPPTESYAAYIAHEMEVKTPRLFRRLGAARISTDVIGQAVTVPESAVCPQRRHPFVCTLPRSQALHAEGANRRWVQTAMEPLVGKGRYLATNGPVCTKTICKGKVDGIYTFYDDLHISATRSRTLARYFRLTVGDLSG